MARFKILIFAVVTVALALVGLLLLSGPFGKLASDEMAERLLWGQTLFETSSQLGQTHRTAALAIAATDPLMVDVAGQLKDTAPTPAVADPVRKAVGAAFQPLPARLKGVAFFLVGNDKGVVAVPGQAGNAETRADPNAFRLASAGLAGPQGTNTVADGKLYQVVATPLRIIDAGGQKTVGWLGAAFPLDDTFAKQKAEELQMSVTLVASGVAATSMAAEYRGSAGAIKDGPVDLPTAPKFGPLFTGSVLAQAKSFPLEGAEGAQVVLVTDARDLVLLASGQLRMLYIILAIFFFALALHFFAREAPAFAEAASPLPEPLPPPMPVREPSLVELRHEQEAADAAAQAAADAAFDSVAPAQPVPQLAPAPAAPPPPAPPFPSPALAPVAATSKPLSSEDFFSDLNQPSAPTAPPQPAAVPAYVSASAVVVPLPAPPSASPLPFSSTQEMYEKPFDPFAAAGGAPAADSTVSAAVPEELLRAAARPAPAPEPTGEATVVSQVPEELLRAAARRSPGMGSGLSPEEAHFQEVFQQFLATRAQCNEPSDGLTFEKFAAKLRKNREQLMQKYNCKSVRFQVYIKDSKAALKATPVRD